MYVFFRFVSESRFWYARARTIFVFLNRDTLKQFPLDASAQDEDDEEQDGSGDDAEPGCCLLCERLMPLTRHHVIPRYLASARLHTSERPR